MKINSEDLIKVRKQNIAAHTRLLILTNSFNRLVKTIDGMSSISVEDMCKHYESMRMDGILVEVNNVPIRFSTLIEAEFKTLLSESDFLRETDKIELNANSYRLLLKTCEDLNYKCIATEAERLLRTVNKLQWVKVFLAVIDSARNRFDFDTLKILEETNVADIKHSLSLSMPVERNIPKADAGIFFEPVLDDFVTIPKLLVMSSNTAEYNLKMELIDITEAVSAINESQVGVPGIDVRAARTRLREIFEPLINNLVRNNLVPTDSVFNRKMRERYSVVHETYVERLLSERRAFKEFELLFDELQCVSKEVHEKTNMNTLGDSCIEKAVEIFAQTREERKAAINTKSLQGCGASLSEEDKIKLFKVYASVLPGILEVLSKLENLSDRGDVRIDCAMGNIRIYSYYKESYIVYKGIKYTKEILLEMQSDYIVEKVVEFYKESGFMQGTSETVMQVRNVLASLGYKETEKKAKGIIEDFDIHTQVKHRL